MICVNLVIWNIKKNYTRDGMKVNNIWKPIDYTIGFSMDD